MLNNMTTAKSTTYPTALTIAGSDSSGGAGIQADIKTFFALGVYGASVITAITAQNTRGIHSVYSLPAAVVSAQLHAVLDDIPFGALKIGMLANLEILQALTSVLHETVAPLPPIILDPVLVSSSGKLLLDVDARSALVDELFPHVALLTPNLPEAALLLGVASIGDVEDAARQLLALGPQAVLIKGGHGSGDLLTDVLVTASGETHKFTNVRLHCDHTHGTGCTLSAAIAANIALGHPLNTAVERSIDWLHSAIAAGWSPGENPGPVHHGWELWPKS